MSDYELFFYVTLIKNKLIYIRYGLICGNIELYVCRENPLS